MNTRSSITRKWFDSLSEEEQTKVIVNSYRSLMNTTALPAETIAFNSKKGPIHMKIRLTPAMCNIILGMERPQVRSALTPLFEEKEDITVEIYDQAEEEE